MTPSRNHPRDTSRDRGRAEPQLRPQGPAVRAGLEAPDVHRARHGGHPRVGHPRRVEPRGDALADRDHGVGPPEKPAGGSVVDSPAVVHRPDQAHCRAGPRQSSQPVVVALVGVDDVDGAIPEHAAQRSDLGAEPPGPGGALERQGLDELDPRLADVRLEDVAANAGEPHRVASILLRARQVQRGVRAPGPPAVRHDVQDPERSHERLASAATTAASTSSTSIARRHRWSMGHSRRKQGLQTG